MLMSKFIQDANYQVIVHLEEVIKNTSFKEKEHIEDMLITMKNNNHTWSIDKTSRWIGFIQGVLFMNKILDLSEERDFTRPLYHKAYKDSGLEIPKTVKLYGDENVH